MDVSHKCVLHLRDYSLSILYMEICSPEEENSGFRNAVYVCSVKF
jgi:hypothetical protein